MEIITGYTGRSHITPSLDASINSAIFGNNNVVLNFGDKLSFSAQTTGRILIGSGALCFSGRIAVSENAEEKEYTIPATGEYSHCKIVARYKKTVSDGTNQESISLVLLQSVDSASSVTAALNLSVNECESNVIDQSTTAADFVLYDFVVSEGGVVTNPVEPKFKVVDSIVSLAQSTEKKVKLLNDDVVDISDLVATNKSDIDGRIESLQNYRISKFYEFSSYSSDKYTFNLLDKKSLILFIVDNQIPFICDFSQLDFTNFGLNKELKNGDYTLRIYLYLDGSSEKLSITQILKREFETKVYEVYESAFKTKKIFALTSKTEEITFEKVRIYRLLQT